MEGTNSHDGAGNLQAGPHAGQDGCADHRPGAARDASASPQTAEAGATATPATQDGLNGREAAGRTYAALDLGTNNCRLLVARPSRRGFKVVDAFSRIIRLGEGVSATGRLSQPAIERTIEALRVCAAKMDRNKVERAGLIATEACRLACNADEFLGRVHKDTGLDIKIVDRETEAKLAVSGCASLIDLSCDFALVFDIGGGSSELIWLDLTQRKHGWRRSLHDRLEVQSCIAAWTSLPVGVVTLAEQFGGKLVNAEIFEAMVRHVARMLEPFEAQHGLRRRLGNGNTHLLGTSGTVTTVAGIHLRLPRYERNKVDGCWLDITQARTVTAELLGSSYEERAAQPCVGKERADLVLAGCAILEALLQTWPCQRLRVADRGLREGILATLMTEDGVYRTGNRAAAGYRRR